MTLQPGDVLLYSATGLYGRIIAIKTWHTVAHVECYVGNGQSVASRNGIGTGRYPLRLTDLWTLCRPRQPFDCAKALTWFTAQPHRPYGWIDLLQFIGVDVHRPGIVCSPFVTEFLRAGDLDPFNGEDADKVAPFEFALSPVFFNLPYSAQEAHA
jgi:hypothetical protein